MTEKKKELSVEEAAKQAYERSNSSLQDYNPRDLDDQDKVTETVDGQSQVGPITTDDRANEQPLEPVQVRADALLPPRGKGERTTS